MKRILMMVLRNLFMVPYGYNYGRPVEEMNPDATVASLLEAANLVS